MANHNAASSEYFCDVFLSCSARTSYGFTGHLYSALRKNGIYVVMNSEELRIGDKFVPDVLAAIEKSRMSMVVLCENYASSTWCLDKLGKIMDCFLSGQPVLAIFYKVKPSDVQNSYEAAMTKHKQRFGGDSEKTIGWESALNSLDHLRKEHCGDHMYEYQLIDKIVKDTIAKHLVPSTIKRISGLSSSYVFLSSGGRTSKAFVDHLCSALRIKGIDAILSDEDLTTGDEISPFIIKTIEKSTMIVVVLCEDYAFSTRCLNELAKIMECHDKKSALVSPIFYKMEPTHVRFQEKSYGSAMFEHEIRYGKDSEKVKAWRSALYRVCDLRRRRLRENESDYELVEKIIEDIRKGCCFKMMRRRVGLDSRFEQVKSLIDIESKDTVCMLGIYGPSGIGKTTFVKDFCHRIVLQFEAASIIQGDTIRDLEKFLNRKHDRKRVLLVVDNVDSVKELETLVKGGDWFASGSRIIIITRYASVLDKYVMDGVIIKKYEMKELNDGDSLDLFCFHAFNTKEPPDDFKDISNRIVKFAKGNPLALEFIGSNLKGLSIEECEMELDKYSKVANAEIKG